ncbi:ubiquitin-conjugating enzyme/RWD-like protein [Favolaschia claudopus]|uniref:E2 ubiquitin-conjugating enzyme n=1 Tax=Favolaschia claudopus TaxID=2862362 RepID=A0AAW0DLF6_9AGAR
MSPLPATLKRITKEISDVRKEDLGDITLVPSDDLFLWHGTLPGPEGSVYEGGVFNVLVNLPSDYPFSAPKVTFKTRIYHMNISDQGNICIDILKHNWSPALSLYKVILSLSSLLTDPNPKDPLVPSIASQYTRNRKLHDSTARKWTDLYARPKPAPPPPAPPPPARATSSQSRARPTRTTQNAIVIDDSDDEAARSRRAGAGAKRKRKAATQTNAREDDDDDVVEVASGSSSKRRAVGERRAVGSTSRVPPIVQGEVIEIDD